MKTLLKVATMPVLLAVAYAGAGMCYIVQSSEAQDKIDEWCPLFRWIGDT